jgi:hypothetical protein
MKQKDNFKKELKRCSKILVLIFNVVGTKKVGMMVKKRCHNCSESRSGPEEHAPFCNPGGDCSGSGTYAETCKDYKQCNCPLCEKEKHK